MQFLPIIELWPILTKEPILVCDLIIVESRAPLLTVEFGPISTLFSKTTFPIWGNLINLSSLLSSSKPKPSVPIDTWLFIIQFSPITEFASITTFGKITVPFPIETFWPIKTLSEILIFLLCLCSLTEFFRKKSKSGLKWLSKILEKISFAEDSVWRKTTFFLF